MQAQNIYFYMKCLAPEAGYQQLPNNIRSMIFTSLFKSLLTQTKASNFIGIYL